MVTTFFANPFGPLQLKDKTIKLLDTYFDSLYSNKVGVGVLYTGLALSKDNPKNAAKELLKLLSK